MVWRKQNNILHILNFNLIPNAHGVLPIYGIISLKIRLLTVWFNGRNNKCCAPNKPNVLGIFFSFVNLIRFLIVKALSHERRISRHNEATNECNFLALSVDICRKCVPYPFDHLTQEKRMTLTKEKNNT